MLKRQKRESLTELRLNLAIARAHTGDIFTEEINPAKHETSLKACPIQTVSGIYCDESSDILRSAGAAAILRPSRFTTYEAELCSSKVGTPPTACLDCFKSTTRVRERQQFLLTFQH